jgi:hypothetical protein
MVWVVSGVGMTAAAGLGRGERAPDMVLPSRDGTPTRYYAHAGGRPALLVLADEACVAQLDALAEGLTAIGWAPPKSAPCNRASPRFARWRLA